MSRENVPVERLCGLAGIAGVFFYAFAVLWLQAATPAEPDWTRHYVSQFANGPHAWLLAAGTLSHAAGNAMLAFGLHRVSAAGWLREWAVGLFLAATAGFALTGVASVEPPGAAASLAGTVHRAAAVASFALELTALILFSVAWRRHAPGCAASTTSVALTAVAGAASAVLVASVLLAWLPGLWERIALVAFMAWELWAACRLVLASSSLHEARAGFFSPFSIGRKNS